VEVEDAPVDILPPEAPILEEEPDVGSGMAAALRLAVSKGYLVKETTKRPSASNMNHLQAQNYSIEDKNYK
jgi:U4/U6.U5 tri-snRNP-associated protein 1